MSKVFYILCVWVMALLVGCGNPSDQVISPDSSVMDDAGMMPDSTVSEMDAGIMVDSGQDATADSGPILDCVTHTFTYDYVTHRTEVFRNVSFQKDSSYSYIMHMGTSANIKITNLRFVVTNSTEPNLAFNSTNTKPTICSASGCSSYRCVDYPACTMIVMDATSKFFQNVLYSGLWDIPTQSDYLFQGVYDAPGGLSTNSSLTNPSFNLKIETTICY